MAEQQSLRGATEGPCAIEQHLAYLKLSFIAEQYAELAQQAAHKAWSHVDYLATLVEGEAEVRRDRATKSRIRLARFPVIKTLEQFRWDWPTRINRLQVQNHFRLTFIHEKANLIFLGGVGLGKTHLATALGYAACLQGYSVFFASAIDVINTLAAAKSAGRLKAELKKYTKPALLILDELGYLPIDKTGADLLFQVISLRYEQGALIITSNRAFKEWPTIFNHDSTLTSAVLDRLLHHADTSIIEGKSFRMQDQLESETSLHQGSPDPSLLTPASSSLTLQCRIFTPLTPQRASHIFKWPIL
jgi:DNA replication protein DnaC